MQTKQQSLAGPLQDLVEEGNANGSSLAMVIATKHDIVFFGCSAYVCALSPHESMQNAKCGRPTLAMSFTKIEMRTSQQRSMAKPMARCLGPNTGFRQGTNRVVLSIGTQIWDTEQTQEQGPAGTPDQAPEQTSGGGPEQTPEQGPE